MASDEASQRAAAGGMRRAEGNGAVVSRASVSPTISCPKGHRIMTSDEASQRAAAG